MNRLYDARPLVLPADSVSKIAIAPLDPSSPFLPGRDYVVEHYATESWGRDTWPLRCPCRVQGNSLEVEVHAFAEQEHVLRLHEQKGNELQFLHEFRLYSLREDLLGRRPYKGDLHMHTFHSDGRESPAIVTAACRAIGLDFMAITDHERYTPSIEAQQAFAGLPLDLRIFPGEELHMPGNPVHIVNFGGSFSVNDLARRENEKVYRTEVRKIQDGLPDLPAEADRFLCASCLWGFDKIRQAGGIGIFCHPYWYFSHQYTPHGALTSYLFETRPFDALELISGYHRNETVSNTLQAARYNEERARGRETAIVGCSDSHGVRCGDLFGWYYTIAWARSASLEDLRESIVDRWSVAVEALPGETPRAHGPFRLVKLAQYLIREYFPLLDTLCAEEGKWMLAHTEKDALAAGKLAALQGQTGRLHRACWSRS